MAKSIGKRIVKLRRYAGVSEVCRAGDRSRDPERAQRVERICFVFSRRYAGVSEVSRAGDRSRARTGFGFATVFERVLPCGISQKTISFHYAQILRLNFVTAPRHIHTMNTRRYMVLLMVVLGSTLGDVFLSRGMRQIGRITMANLSDLSLAIANPWIVVGTLLLIAFFASYLSALSWADLSYVMLITAFGNVLTALLARFMLHEQIPFTRWAGIMLITFGVAFVGQGPSLTVSADHPAQDADKTPEHTTSGEPMPAGAAAPRERNPR